MLKRINRRVLSSLTSYLFYSKQVFIPHIGRFELRYIPARLDFTNRMIHPPGTEVFFSEDGSLQQEQLSFLGERLGINKYLLEEKLKAFGHTLKEDISRSAFNWNGFGELEFVNNKIIFHPNKHQVLKAVPANRVIRRKAQHAVRVGEKEMHSGDTSYIDDAHATSTPQKLTIEWIVALLAIAFIVFYLYRAGFSPVASGSQQRVVSTATYNTTSQ